MIALESVSKRYGSRTIIHDVSFTVGKGEIVGFLGPNGAGKTTTMRMIAGYTTATSGRVTVAGFDMATQNEDAARKLGYLPEQPPLYDVLDVSAYLRFVAKAKGVPLARDSTRSGPRHQLRADWRASCGARSTSCRRATVSESALPRRCSANRKCCCSTSRPQGWTRDRSRRRAR